MPKGRKPTPTKIKQLMGVTRQDRLNLNEPQPSAGIPECPECLEGESKAEWKRITPELEACGLLTMVDRAALTCYCQAWANWIEAEEKLREKGPVIKTKKRGLVLNPCLRAANMAMNQVRAFLVEFGMSPSSRSRITSTKAAPKDGLESFLNVG